MPPQTNSETSNEHGFGARDIPPTQYDSYSGSSFYLTMRDGVRLAVTLVLPKPLAEGDKIPTLLSQTRYWRDTELRAPFKWFLKADDLNPRFKNFKPFFAARGYALILVDVRGTGASFGTWPYPWHDETIQDSVEIVDWIISQPWSNGLVGAYGISYLGTTAELLAIIDHPAVKAIIPMFNHPDPYLDIAYPGGIFNRRFIEAWSRMNSELDQNLVPEELGFLGRLLVKGVMPVDGEEGRRLLEEAIEAHASNGIVFSLAKDVSFRDEVQPDVQITAEELSVYRFQEELTRSNVAICGWGSWMDAGTADAVIRRFLTFDNVRRAVIGAWEHGGQFHASPYVKPTQRPNPDMEGQWTEMIRFLDAFLKTGAENDLEAKHIREERALFYYTMGEEKWKVTSVWPPAGTEMIRWYLDAPNILSRDKATDESGQGNYLVDFSASSGQFNRWWEIGGLFGQTVHYPDRHEAMNHLLAYTSLPLAGELEITGYPIITLYVASSEPDIALYVYLDDVAEDGTATYVTEGQLRSIHHHLSKAKPPYAMQTPYHSFRQADAKPLTPGEITEITFGLQPTSALIKKGNQLRVSIGGHDEGTFERIPAEGLPLLTIFRNNIHASHIDLPVVWR